MGCTFLRLNVGGVPEGNLVVTLCVSSRAQAWLALDYNPAPTARSQQDINRIMIIIYNFRSMSQVEMEKKRERNKTRVVVPPTINRGVNIYFRFSISDCRLPIAKLSLFFRTTQIIER